MISLTSGLFGIYLQNNFESWVSMILFVIYSSIYFIFANNYQYFKIIKSMILNFLKKIIGQENSNVTVNFEIELTASVLAYEIARSDGEITDEELAVLMNEIEKIANKVGKSNEELLKIIEIYSKDSISFHEFVEDINNNYTKQQKLDLLKFMWKMAYADKRLDVDEERLIRRMADLIKIKDIEVLKLKNLFRV